MPHPIESRMAEFSADAQELIEFSLLINNLKSMRRRTLEDMLSPDLPPDRIRDNLREILMVRKQMIVDNGDWGDLPALWIAEISALPLLLGWRIGLGRPRYLIAVLAML